MKSEDPDKERIPFQVPKYDKIISKSFNEKAKQTNKNKPNNEYFIPNAANDTLPINEPSTCASGNQIEKGYTGVFINNDKIKIETLNVLTNNKSLKDINTKLLINNAVEIKENNNNTNIA